MISSDEVNVPVGLYHYTTWQTKILSPRSNLTSVELEYQGGPYFDDTRNTVTIMPYSKDQAFIDAFHQNIVQYFCTV